MQASFMDSGNSVIRFHHLGPILFVLKQVYCFKMNNPFYTGDSLMITLANSKDPDAMWHDAAFHQGLHCLLRQKQPSEKYYF